MVVHSRDEALMCKIFPSSLGPMAMRWFNGLKVDSIDSFMKLTQAFGARLITCGRVPQSWVLAIYVHARWKDSESLLR